MQKKNNKCLLCPRKCNIDRDVNVGFCQASNKVKIAKVMLHKFEEPIISFDKGSGAVFFSGCNLKCCYCQNYQISCQNYGTEISTERLAEIFCELENAGADNINLVTGTHFTLQIAKALQLAKVKIPVVFNCGGYESVDTLKMLDGLVDIYIPDFKYSIAEVADKYSSASDYPLVVINAIKEMLRQVGKPVYDDKGKLVKGVIIRHLVLPENVKNSLAVLEAINANFKSDEVLISIMSQFTPYNKACKYPELNRRLKPLEYNIILKKVKELAFNGYIQELSSAKEEYTPTFDCSGVIKKFTE